MRNKQFNSAVVLVPLCAFLTAMLMGFAVYARQNINYFQYNLKHRFEMVVFLKKDAPAPEVIGEKIRALKNVREIQFVSKEEVKNKLADLKEEIVTGGDNPFPDSFSVLMVFHKVTRQNAEKLAEELRALAGVEEVRYDYGLLGLVQNLHLLVLFVSWFLRITLGAVAAVFVLGIALNFAGLKAALSCREGLLLLAGTGLAAILGAAGIELLMMVVGLSYDFVTVTLKWRAILSGGSLLAAFTYFTLHAKTK